MEKYINSLDRRELAQLIRDPSGEMRGKLQGEAAKLNAEAYSGRIFIRGLIEFSSLCRNNCLYCGLRRDNLEIPRTRLELDDIMSTCADGYAAGIRSFVLQSGEDLYYTNEILCGIIAGIKSRWADCAVTLSVGEKPESSYRAYKAAGADRFLLRHETADPVHYQTLHPVGMTFQSRKECLYSLKRTGFQVGAGFMTGSPGQTPEHLAEDIIFLRELRPQMVGIGPFIPQKSTPFRGFPAGDPEQTLLMLSLVRITLPRALIPATTALETLLPGGRKRAFDHGANVVMLNISPEKISGKYQLYNGKALPVSKISDALGDIQKIIRSSGYIPDTGRGDHGDYEAITQKELK